MKIIFNKDKKNEYSCHWRSKGTLRRDYKLKTSKMFKKKENNNL